MLWRGRETGGDERSRRLRKRHSVSKPGSSHRPRPEPVGRVPGEIVRRRVTDPPACRQEPAQGQLDAPGQASCPLMNFAMDQDGPRRPAVLLKPFRPGSAHIVQLRPVAIRQISHRHIPTRLLAHRASLRRQGRPEHLANVFMCGNRRRLFSTRVNRLCARRASLRPALGVCAWRGLWARQLGRRSAQAGRRRERE